MKIPLVDPRVSRWEEYALYLQELTMWRRKQNCQCVIMITVRHEALDGHPSPSLLFGKQTRAENKPSVQTHGAKVKCCPSFELGQNHNVTFLFTEQKSRTGSRSFIDSLLATQVGFSSSIAPALGITQMTLSVEHPIWYCV